MKIWAPLLIALMGVATCSAAGGDAIYPFKGRLDVINGLFELSVKIEEGRLNFKVDRQEDRSYGAVLDVTNMRTPFFDMTTQLQGVVHVEKDNAQPDKITGRLWSQNTSIDGNKDGEISGNFEFEQGIIHLMDVVWGGFTGSGDFDIRHPYPLNSHIVLKDVDIACALDWLAGQKKKLEGHGEMSGNIDLSGTPEKLSVKANILSQKGHIQELSYDLLSLHLQGIYPLVDLTNSTVTKTNSFSFNLGGTVDLSDKTNMISQIQSIQKIPLIKDNVLQSEWVLKRVPDDEKNGKTETSFFLKKGKQGGLSGQEDSSLLGVQKKIGF